MVTSEYPASAALAQDWIEAWNTRDLDRLLSHYHPEIEFTSPRISEAYYASDGKVGSSNGTVRGIDSLREYFREALRTVRGLHLELLHVTRGLHGAVAIVYRRESGTVATEILRVDQGRVIRAEALYGVGTM